MTSARTVCELFQSRAGEAEAERVERIAAGLAALGVHHGEPVALLLGDHPERHLIAAAVMHLGAPMLADEQRASVVITEPGQLARVLAAQDAGAPVAEIVLAGGSHARAIPLAEVEASRPAGFEFAQRWQAVTPSDRLTGELTHDDAVRGGRAVDLLGLEAYL